MTHPLDIPEFLKLSAEERRAGWQRNPPRAMPAFGREISETERLYRASIERDKAKQRAIDEQRFREMRERDAQDKAEREAVAAEVQRNRRKS